MTDPADIAGLCERLNRRDLFKMDPVSLQRRLRNPDGPEAATALAELSAKLVEVAIALAEADRKNDAQADAWNAAESALTTATARIAELEAALMRCRTNIGGYAITKADQYPGALADMWAEVQRVDAIARQALERKP